MAVVGTSSTYIGLAYPFANDHGDLCAYTLTAPPVCTPMGCYSPSYEGGVVQSRDGWEVHRLGRAVISREGRWAAFSSFGHTIWLDLWTGDEPAVGETLSVTSMADDGTLATPRDQPLFVSTPGREPRLLDLPFAALNAMVDRSGTVAAVSSGRGVYRVDLPSGAVEDWAPTWDNVQLQGIDTGGNRLLFSQWNVRYVVERGGSPRRLSEEGQFVYGAALTGDDRTAVASTLSGIVRYSLDDAPAEVKIEQPDSPFAPLVLSVPVQLAAPHLLIQRDLGEENATYANGPYLLHAASGEAVTFSNPACPGESIEVLMTGLNHQGPAVEWTVNWSSVSGSVQLFFDGERAHESNDHWRWVALVLPGALPGAVCTLRSVFGTSTSSASLFASAGLANEGADTAA